MRMGQGRRDLHCLAVLLSAICTSCVSNKFSFQMPTLIPICKCDVVLGNVFERKKIENYSPSTLAPSISHLLPP